MMGQTLYRKQERRKEGRKKGRKEGPKKVRNEESSDAFRAKSVTIEQAYSWTIEVVTVVGALMPGNLELSSGNWQAIL